MEEEVVEEDTRIVKEEQEQDVELNISKPPTTATTMDETSNFFFRARPKKVISSIKRALQESAKSFETEEVKEYNKRNKVESSFISIDNNVEEEEKQSEKNTRENIIIIDDTPTHTGTVDHKLSPEIVKKYKNLLTPSPNGKSPKVVESEDSIMDFEFHPRLQSSLLHTSTSTTAASASRSDNGNKVTVEVTIVNCFPTPHGKLCKYLMRPDDLFENVFLAHSRAINKSINSLYFTRLDGLRLFGSSSPASLNLPPHPFTLNAHTAESYEELKRLNCVKREELLLKSQDLFSKSDYFTSDLTEDTPKSCATVNELKLKFKSGNKIDPVTLCVDPTQPLSTVIEKLKEALSVTGTIRLFFDGDLVREGDTPESMGLEDEDLIEVRIL